MNTLGQTLSHLADFSFYNHLMPWVLALMACVSVGFTTIYVLRRPKHRSQFKVHHRPKTKKGKRAWKPQGTETTEDFSKGERP